MPGLGDLGESVESLLSRTGVSSELRELMGSHSVAGSTVTVKVTGLAELEAALEALPPLVARKHLRAAVAEATDLFFERAHQLAPYEQLAKHGIHLLDALAKSVTVKGDGVHGATVIGTVFVPPKAFWGRFLEFGWVARNGRHIPASPWMRPAFDSQKYAAIARVAQRLTTGVQEAARELHK